MAQPPAKIDNDDKEGGDTISALQFIAFKIGNEEYGVDIMAVREIKGWVPATRLPNAPHYVRGVINLRGIMVPIFDLRCRFGGGETEITRTHVVIILNVQDRVFGVLVDSVSDILTIQAPDIKPAPDMDRTVDSSYLQGLVTIENRMIALLVLDKLFSVHEINEDEMAAIAVR